MAFAPKLIEVRADVARQVVYEGQAVQLRNRDELTVVYLGPDEGFDPAGQGVAILDPLGSQALDGTDDVWALTRAGTAVVNSIPGGLSGEVSPAEIAAQIALQGFTVNVSQASFVVVPSGDVTGAKDTAALVSALALYGSVSLAAGTYFLSQTLTWILAELVGAGRATVIQPGTAWAGGGPLLQPGMGASVRCVYGYGGTTTRSANPAANFIQLGAGAAWWVIDSVDCDYMNGQIIAVAPATGSHGRISGIRGEHNGGGIRIDNGTGTSITAEIDIGDCDIQNCETSEILYLSAVTDIRRSGPFNGSIASGAAVSGITIQGSCQSCDTGAIDIGGGTGTGLLVYRAAGGFSPTECQAGPGVVQSGQAGVVVGDASARLTFTGLWAKRMQGDGWQLNNTGAFNTMDKCGGNLNGLGAGPAYDVDDTSTGHWLNDGFSYVSSGVTAGRNLASASNHYTEANPPSSLTTAGFSPGGW